VNDLYSNYQRCVSVAGRQIDTSPYVDLVKRIEAFPATKSVCEKLFCELYNQARDFWQQMSDSLIVHLLMIKARIIWSDATHIKECAEALGEVQSDT
jgi:hypothetical protein